MFWTRSRTQKWATMKLKNGPKRNPYLNKTINYSWFMKWNWIWHIFHLIDMRWNKTNKSIHFICYWICVCLVLFCVHVIYENKSHHSITSVCYLYNHYVLLINSPNRQPQPLQYDEYFNGILIKLCLLHF